MFKDGVTKDTVCGATCGTMCFDGEVWGMGSMRVHGRMEDGSGQAGSRLELRPAPLCTQSPGDSMPVCHFVAPVLRFVWRLFDCRQAMR